MHNVYMPRQLWFVCSFVRTKVTQKRFYFHVYRTDMFVQFSFISKLIFTLFALKILSPIVHISILHLLCVSSTPSIVTFITIAANSICQTPLMSPLLKMCHNCFYLVYVFFFKWLLISRMTSLPLTFINAEVFGVNENGFGVNDLSAPIAFCS